MHAGGDEQQVDPALALYHVPNTALNLAVVANITLLECTIRGFLDVEYVRSALLRTQQPHHGIPHP